MKKNSIIMTIACVAMAATVAVGGTLAFLTDVDNNVAVAANAYVDIEQFEMQRAEGVAHTGTLKEGDLVPFVQGQKLYPAYPVNNAATDYSAEQTDLLYWGPYVTGQGAGNGLWNDNKLIGAMDKFVFVQNTGTADCYYRTVIAFECPVGMEYSEGADKHFMMNTNGNTRFDWEEIGYATIGGTRYWLEAATYKEALTPGEISRPSLLQVVMTDNVTSEDAKKLGDSYEILAYTQAVQVENMPNADAALDAAFGNITATEHPWAGEGKAPEIPVLVDDAKELVNALNAGKDVVLTDDIALDEQSVAVVKGQDVSLNLGGNNITKVSAVSDRNGDGTYTSADNQSIFQVKGNMSVEGKGTISVKNNGGNMGWSALSAAFTVEGGTLTLGEDVIVSHEGGTDMAFAVDVNTTLGDSTLNVNGAILSSSYIGVRLFNFNKNYKATVNVNSGAIDGNRRDIWKQAAGPSEINIADGMAYTIEHDGDEDYYFFGTAVANTTSALKKALADGKDVVVTPGTYGTFPSSSAKADTVIECMEGTVFEGQSSLDANGATVVGAEFSNPAGNAVRGTIDGTFKDCTFDGSNGLRWCYAGETVVFENCVFSGDVYGAHFDGGANEVVFKNCTFSGFNAMGSAITKLTMEGCTFKANGRSNYNGINLWGSTEMKNCTFVFDGTVDYEWVDACSEEKVYTFTNCVVTNGVTETPFKDIISCRKPGQCTVKVDGVEITEFN